VEEVSEEPQAVVLVLRVGLVQPPQQVQLLQACRGVVNVRIKIFLEFLQIFFY
jgi:hypothetical protein